MGRIRDALAPIRARVDTSAAPAAVLQAELLVGSACWCQSLSPNMERWKRSYKAIQIEVNPAADVLLSFVVSHSRII